MAAFSLTNGLSLPAVAGKRDGFTLDRSSKLLLHDHVRLLGKVLAGAERVEHVLRVSADYQPVCALLCMLSLCTKIAFARRVPVRCPGGKAEAKQRPAGTFKSIEQMALGDWDWDQLVASKVHLGDLHR